VTPIRPSAFPVQPPQTNAVSGAGADAARAAAQKAFFDAAMGRTTAPAAPAAPQAVAPRPTVFAPAPAPVQRAEIRPDPAAEPPTRVLRPGSLLDIRV
jgi:hypothetical protein